MGFVTGQPVAEVLQHDDGGTLHACTIQDPHWLLNRADEPVVLHGGARSVTRYS